MVRGSFSKMMTILDLKDGMESLHSRSRGLGISGRERASQRSCFFG